MSDEEEAIAMCLVKIKEYTDNNKAFYSFNDGFALLRLKDTIVVDAKPNILLKGNNENLDRQAHAFVQCIMEQIDNL